MRPPTERDQCQAKLDILIEGFMRADWTAYRDAAALATRLYQSEKYRTTNRGGEGESARACDKGRRSPPRLFLKIDGRWCVLYAGRSWGRADTGNTRARLAGGWMTE